jgi:nucleoside-diphosphate-sugar epimerase
MRILVTGSEGSLMQSVIPKLIKNGHTVIGVDNFSRYGKIDRVRNYELIIGDLTDTNLVEKITLDIDLVIQGAAIIYGVKGFHRYPADILGKDVTLHKNILSAALKNKVKKVVYISSSMVYERAENVPSEEIDIDSMLIPLTDYGLSKLVGERLSIAYHSQYGLDYTIWRPFNIITPYEKAENEIGFSHVFADFIDRIIIKEENPLRVIGSGEQIRCFTWIEDVSDAIANFSTDSRSDNKIFNIGNPRPISMISLAKEIHSIAVKKNLIKNSSLAFTNIEAPKDDVQIRIPSIDKISKEFNWLPKISLDNALNICIDVVKKIIE